MLLTLMTLIIVQHICAYFAGVEGVCSYNKNNYWAYYCYYY